MVDYASLLQVYASDVPSCMAKRPSSYDRTMDTGILEIQSWTAIQPLSLWGSKSISICFCPKISCRTVAPNLFKYPFHCSLVPEASLILYRQQKPENTSAPKKMYRASLGQRTVTGHETGLHTPISPCFCLLLELLLKQYCKSCHLPTPPSHIHAFTLSPSQQLCPHHFSSLLLASGALRALRSYIELVESSKCRS